MSNAISTYDPAMGLAAMRIQCPLDEDVVMLDAPPIEAVDADPNIVTSPYGAQKLFAIVELAELVLLNDTITTEQLFAMQRISRGFQHLIKHSLPMRKKMCLAHAPMSSRRSPVVFGNTPPGQEDMLQSPRMHLPIGNPNISRLFGIFAINHFPRSVGGLVQVHGRQWIGGDRCALHLWDGPAIGTWRGILIADCPLVAVHYRCRSLYFTGYCEEHLHSVQTLGDLHRVLGSFGHETDCLELVPSSPPDPRIDLRPHLILRHLSHKKHLTHTPAGVDHNGKSRRLQKDSITFFGADAHVTSFMLELTSIQGLAIATSMVHKGNIAPVSVHGSPTVTTATRKFFAIIELVEQVLLDDAVTMEQLFVVQRVSTEFRAMVQGSLRLKRKMGLEYPAEAVKSEDKAFGQCGFSRQQHSDVVQLELICGTSGNDGLPRPTLATASWMHIKMANVPLFGRFYCYTEGIGTPTLEMAVKDYHDLQTLGNVHRIIAMFEHELDYLELEPAAERQGIKDDSASDSMTREPGGDDD
ncbi:hypothetical protein LTR95_008944 [Oleoguttula sp. CCFEE 5521]